VRTRSRLASTGVMLVALVLSGCGEQDAGEAVVPADCEGGHAQDGVGPETGVTCPEGL
jgi:hypothetical protein